MMQELEDAYFTPGNVSVNTDNEELQIDYEAIEGKTAMEIGEDVLQGIEIMWTVLKIKEIISDGECNFITESEAEEALAPLFETLNEYTLEKWTGTQNV